MPQTLRVESPTDNDVIPAVGMREGRAYVVVTCNPWWSYRPGDVVFRAGNLTCNTRDHTTAGTGHADFRVRPLRPGERAIIEGV